MRFTTSSIFLVLLSSAFASPITAERNNDNNGDLDDKYNIFKNSDRR
jgi:hypothetical protein